MEITLEKIELVKEKTGVSYKEAKAALEETEGSVVDAIIKLELGDESESEKIIVEKGAVLLDALKDTISKGNASKIRITNENGESILTIPVTIGLIGAFITPWGLIIATAAAFGFRCNIEVVKTDGTVVDVSGTARDSVNVAVEKGYGVAGTAKEKSKETMNKVKESPIFEKVVKSDVYDKLKEKKEDVFNKGKKDINDFAEDFMSDIEDEKEDIIEKVEEKKKKK